MLRRTHIFSSPSIVEEKTSKKKTSQKRKEKSSSPYIRGGLRRGYFKEKSSTK